MFQTLCSEIENQDIEAFTEAVKQFDSISRLDAWYTTLLLRWATILRLGPNQYLSGLRRGFLMEMILDRITSYLLCIYIFNF